MCRCSPASLAELIRHMGRKKDFVRAMPAIIKDPSGKNQCVIGATLGRNQDFPVVNAECAARRTEPPANH